MTTDNIRNIPLYNSKIVKNYKEYLQKNHPEIDLDAIFEYADILSYQLEDGAHWFTQQQTDRFQEILKKKIPDTNIPREAGRQFAMSKAAVLISQYALGFITPVYAYAMLEKLQPLVTRACTLETKKIGLGKVEVIVKPLPGVEEKPYQCENRIGTYESIARLFTGNIADIDHPICIHRGGDHCHYVISWENTPLYRWKRICSYSFFAAVGLSAASAFLLPGALLFPVIALCTVVVAALFYYSKNLEVKDLTTNLKNQGETAKNLITETNIRYNNVMLIQEIGQAISAVTDTGTLLEFIMECLKKRLDFDRGMIMLNNREKTRLIYSAGFGYNLEDEKYVSGTEFHLDNPDSKGPFIESYRRKIPILVDNFEEIEDNLSKRSRNFAERLSAQSFICIPITFEGEAMGLLVVDNIHSKRRLNQTDVNLLMGIAPQIAISINNARGYQLLRESEEMFRSLSENAPDIIYTTDINGRITYVSPACERVLGYHADEVKGKYFLDFMPVEETTYYTKLFKELIGKRETVRDHTLTLFHKDRSERFFSMSGTTNLDADGNVIGLIGVIKDITDRKQLEARFLHAQKMEAIGTLAGGIAHNFNNLLMGIQGFTSLLMMHIDKHHAHFEKLKRIENIIDSGAGLTRQLLGFARGEKYETKATNLNELVEKTSNIFGSTQKDIRIHKKYHDDLWTAEVDRGQVEQVLMNLYVNAWQAMPVGGDLYLETSNFLINADYAKLFSVSPGRYVRISIKDTGIGMDKKTLDRIFEPFFTTKEMGRGTGLGLASAYGIIKGHSGIIHAESEPGHGTTFYLYLHATPKEVVQEDQATLEIERGKGTILLVDDEEMIVDVCREILMSLGYEVLPACSGHEAIEIFKKNGRNIDLVILDVVMPGIGAEETFDTLKGMDPGVKIILSSGYSLNNRVRNLMERGCNGFIQKPYNIASMSKKIKEAVCVSR